MFWAIDTFDELLDKATSPSLTEPSLSFNVQLCDLIRHGKVPAIYALNAVRLKCFSRNPQTSLHAVFVLDAMVKKAGPFVHKEVRTKAFCEILHDLLAAIRDKEVLEKLRQFIRDWYAAFQKNPGPLKDVMDAIEFEGFLFAPLMDPEIDQLEIDILNSVAASSEDDNELKEHWHVVSPISDSDSDSEWEERGIEGLKHAQFLNNMKLIKAPQVEPTLKPVDCDCLYCEIGIGLSNVNIAGTENGLKDFEGNSVVDGDDDLKSKQKEETKSTKAFVNVIMAMFEGIRNKSRQRRIKKQIFSLLIEADTDSEDSN